VTTALKSNQGFRICVVDENGEGGGDASRVTYDRDES
jgi:hypothetical protein